MMRPNFSMNQRMDYGRFVHPGLLLLLGWILLSILLRGGLSQNTVIEHLPLFCPFRAITGIPCPGCGMTRAFLALAEGDLFVAFHYNPFSIPLFAGMIFSSFPVHLAVPQEMKRYFYLVALLVIVLWWFWTRLMPSLM